MKTKLHIIALDIPFPANYGGAIDIFYKIKTLHSLGIGIILHCFEYKKQSSELNKYCEKVYYYPRQLGWKNQLSKLPYIVKTRNHPDLLTTLLQDESPILFEGLHSTFLLNSPKLKERLKIVRNHNIEGEYYHHLAKNTSNWRKLYYYLEAFKIRKYEAILNHADILLNLSSKDQAYFKNRFPDKQHLFLPAFYQTINSQEKYTVKDYVLYHGNLEIQDNYESALWLIDHVFRFFPKQKVIITGRNPVKKLQEKIAKHPHISLIENPSDKEMNRLLNQALLHTLISFQQAGVKLKLIHALSTNRPCLVNSILIEGSELEKYCLKSNLEDFKNNFEKIITLNNMSFNSYSKLDFYNNKKNAANFIKILINSAKIS